MTNDVLQEIRSALAVAITAEVINHQGLIDYDVLDLIREEATEALQKLDAYIADKRCKNGAVEVCPECDIAGCVHIRTGRKPNHIDKWVKNYKANETTTIRKALADIRGCKAKEIGNWILGGFKAQEILDKERSPYNAYRHAFEINRDL